MFFAYGKDIAPNSMHPTSIAFMSVNWLKFIQDSPLSVNERRKDKNGYIRPFSFKSVLFVKLVLITDK
mgnify:CR=1 FL=1